MGYKQSLNTGQKRWKYPVSAGELMIWLGLLVYIGAYKIPDTQILWNTNGIRPLHTISKFMTKERFFAIKSILHLSPPLSEEDIALGNHQSTFQKLEPLSGNLRKRFQQLITPSTHVSIDEIIAKFTGRSPHTLYIKNKPIPKGFKILALCDRGYTFDYLYTSRGGVPQILEENIEIATEGLTWRPSDDEPAFFNDLSSTSRAVVQLALSLPRTRRDYVIYFDNFFSNTRLLSALRFYNIAASGTARTNSAEYPQQLKKHEKRGNKWNWGKTEDLVVRDVSHICWRDRVLVRFMTTCYKASEITNVPRKRPHGTNLLDRQEIQRLWGEEYRTTIPQLSIAVDYNLFMGGVDIADQMRSYYSCHMKSQRNWMPLFYWLVDATICNSYIITKELLGDTNQRLAVTQPRQFRTDLAWNLVIRGAALTRGREHFTNGYNPQTDALSRRHRDSGITYCKEGTRLPDCRLDTTKSHKRASGLSRRQCFYCRWKKLNSNSEDSDKVPQTKRFCSACSPAYPLCVDCFNAFHSELETP